MTLKNPLLDVKHPIPFDQIRPEHVKPAIEQLLADAEALLRDAALEYHRSPSRGKIAVTPTKPLSNQRDLSLAYSPGVAYACLAIQEDPSLAVELFQQPVDFHMVPLMVTALSSVMLM